MENVLVSKGLKTACPSVFVFVFAIVVLLYQEIEISWGEFNNARARRALVDRYLSLFVMCKAWHQYKERLKALALLNSPLYIVYCVPRRL